MPPKAHVGATSTEWRTGKRQPTETQPTKDGDWILRISVAPYPGAKKDKPKPWDVARSTDAGYNMRWATRAAAIAAKQHFKAWVNAGRNSQQRGAQAASAVARAAAVAEARARPHLPVRFSGRRWIAEAVDSAAGGEGVDESPDKLSGGFDLSTADTAVLVERWKKRSAQVVDRAKRRRLNAEAAAESIPSGVWEDFFSRCRRMTEQLGSQPSSSRPKQPPRGPSHALRIGRRVRRAGHAARREQRWAAQKEAVAAAHLVRVARIERLQKALLAGDVASLLRPDEGDAAVEGSASPGGLSPKQASRLTTQGWAVLHFYKEVDAIELGVIEGTREVPKGGVKLAAAAAGGAFVGASAEAVRDWAYDFEAASAEAVCGFSPDQRGKWERELLIHEEHLQKPFHRWMIEQAKEEKLSVEAALEYLNSTLLRPPYVTQELLDEYHITLPVSNKAAWYWMKQSGAVAGEFKQSFYTDTHEKAAVLKDKQVACRRLLLLLVNPKRDDVMT
jgi:hypothetical protein